MPPKRQQQRSSGGKGGDLPVVLGALTGGLLASSCCVVQLALNALSVGCAGFSVLRPYRPHLRAATAALLALLLVRHGASRRTLGTAVAALLLTYSEDAVGAANRAGWGPLRALLQRAGEAAQLLRVGSAAPHKAAVVRWRLDVAGMRCQACAARVRAAAAALPGVRNASVDLAAGAVEVWADASAAAGSGDGGGGGGAAAVTRGGALVAAVAALDPSYRVALAGAECFSAAAAAAACPANLEAVGAAAGVGGGSSNGGGAAKDGGVGEPQQCARQAGDPAQQEARSPQTPVDEGGGEL